MRYTNPRFTYLLKDWKFINNAIYLTQSDMPRAKQTRLIKLTRYLAEDPLLPPRRPTVRTPQPRTSPSLKAPARWNPGPSTHIERDMTSSSMHKRTSSSRSILSTKLYDRIMKLHSLNFTESGKMPRPSTRAARWSSG